MLSSLQSFNNTVPFSVPFSAVLQLCINYSSSKCDLSPNINSKDSGNILSFMSDHQMALREKQILPNKQKTSNFDVKDA